MARSPRTVFLDPVRIQMPVGALTSIGHRIAGIVLAASFPFAVYLLDRSLLGEHEFAEVAALFDRWPVRAMLVIMVWALAHHLLAGVRHLLTDIGVGSPLRSARRSAWLVNVGGAVVALSAAGVVM